MRGKGWRADKRSPKNKYASINIVPISRNTQALCSSPHNGDDNTVMKKIKECRI